MSSPSHLLAHNILLTASHHPNASAIRWSDGEWNYRQFMDAVYYVAHQIKITQPSPKRVLLVFEQNERMIASLVGTLLVGAAYVPVDPTSPAERLRFIATDSSVDLVLCDNECLQLVTEAALSLPVIVIEKILENSPPLAPSGDGDSLAYILYTSGTTGAPKGVMQANRNVVGIIGSYVDALRIESSDRLTLLPSYAFDAAVMDIFASLLSGASLCILPVRRLGFKKILEQCANFGCTIWHSTPTLFDAVFSISHSPVNALRLAVFGGEELTPRHFRLAQKRLPSGCTVVNGFGPTECTVALQHHMPLSHPIGENIPVGRPLSGFHVLIKNEGGAEAERGEIVIQSSKLAIGYWNDPALTSAKFKKDEAGHRQYHTGDLGERLSDGTIVFLGRLDHQIKFRGIRVEPAEIELALQRYPGVSRAIVVVQKTSIAEQLIAFFLADKPLHASLLREYLAQSIPSSIIPNAFFQLDSIPLRPNGKVDLAALRRSQETDLARGDGEVNNAADRVAAIWQEFLDVPVTNYDTDFLDLGGDSLSALQISLRQEEELGVSISLSKFFGGLTVRAVSEVSSSSLATPPHPIIAHNPRFWDLAPPQLRLLRRPDFNVRASNQNICFGLTIVGTLNDEALERAIHLVLERHPILNTRIRPDSVPRFEISGDVSVFVERPAYNGKPDKAEEDEFISALMESEAGRAFNLCDEAPFRAILVQLSQHRAALIITINHMVCDGWSAALVKSELFQLYTCIVGGKALPAPPAGYAEFEAWRRGIELYRDYEADLRYWKEQLRGACGPLQAKPEVPPYSSAKCRFIISGDDSELVRLGSKHRKCSIFMLFLAAFNGLLFLRRPVDAGVTVGCAAAGRSHARFRRTVGLFDNVLLLRTMVDDRMTLKQLVDATREVAVQGLQRQDVPFTLIADSVTEVRAMQSAPSTHAMLTFNNFDFRIIQPPGVSIRSFPKPKIPMRGALFLDVEDTGDTFVFDIFFREDIFSGSDIGQLWDNFLLLVFDIASDPDRPLKAC